MNGPNHDGWLVVVGLVYPVVAFGVLLGCGGPMGPLTFHPFAIPLPAVLLAATVLCLRSSGVPFRSWVMALFMMWLIAVVYAQWTVYAAAAAAV